MYVECAMFLHTTISSYYSNNIEHDRITQIKMRLEISICCIDMDKVCLTHVFFYFDITKVQSRRSSLLRSKSLYCS